MKLVRDHPSMRDGQCRRRAPTVVDSSANGVEYGWPQVSATDCCGEFEEQRAR